jgi:hypothetical protein
MTNSRRLLIAGATLALITMLTGATVQAQDTTTILAGAEANRIVPPGFYFQGQSAPTQMRNSAVARFGSKRYVIAGLVDTAGYAAEIRAKYQGFFITDSPIKINGSELAPGAYGFGFSNDGKLNILDLTNKEVLSVSSTKDNALKRARPLMMTKSDDGVRLYAGKDYVVLTAN